MKRCSVRPYTGRGKYIFVSYCHKDKRYVFPIIEQMARDGFNVWYNEESKSEAGWTETLAGYLGESTICLAVISKNSLNSHDCRKEINYAILKKKHFISVILEPVELSLAMQLQLSGGQSFVKYEFQNNRAFFEKLYESQVIRGCYSEPNPSVIVSRPEDYDDDDEGGKKEIGGITIGIFGPLAKQNSQKGATDIYSNDEEIEQNSSPKKEPEKKPIVEEAEIPKATIPYLVRANNGEVIHIDREEFMLGRSETKASYTLHGNTMIGREHAKIVHSNGDYFIFDNKSINKTHLNSLTLEPEQYYKLSDGDVIRLANEMFSFHLQK